MRRKFGILMIVAGVLLILGAWWLLISNQREATEAGDASVEVLPQLISKIEQRVEAREEAEAPTVQILPGTPPELLKPEDLEMKEEVVEGYSYIGYLSIPALKLDLPIMSQWDYPKLQIAPCRYSGTLLGGDLVLLAHNYTNHFGRLKELSPGDTVIFMDVDGNVTRFEVAAMDILEATAVEEMVAGNYDLTLFTCTYGGKSRVTVFCDREKEGD